MENKKAMSIPIWLLVILTLVLIITSLFYFNIKQKDVKETMMIPDEIDRVYVKEVQLNYYLDDIFYESTKDFEIEYGKQVFIENYTKELSRYKINGNWIMDELGQVESQIVENNVELNETAIILKLSLEILGGKKTDGKEVINIKYDYSRKFEKVFSKISKLELSINEETSQDINGVSHKFKLTSINDKSAVVLISSDPIMLTLELNKPQKVDINGDGNYDIEITLDSIDHENKIAYLTLKEISYLKIKPTPPTIEPALGNYTFASNHHILLDGVDTNYSLSASYSDGGGYLLGWMIKHKSSVGEPTSDWVGTIINGEISFAYPDNAIELGLMNYYFDDDTLTFNKIGSIKPSKPPVEPALGNYTFASNHHILLDGVDTNYSLSASWSEGGGYFLAWMIIQTDRSTGPPIGFWVGTIINGEISFAYPDNAIELGLMNYYFDDDTLTFNKIGSIKPSKPPVEPALGNYTFASNHHILLDGVDTNYSLSASYSDGGGYLLGWMIKYKTSVGELISAWVGTIIDGKISFFYPDTAIELGLMSYYFNEDTHTFNKI